MKTFCFGVMLCCLVGSAGARPGDAYVLTGKEKSVFGIFKADMAGYPELYKDVDINAYYTEFKNINNLGERKLKVGEELVFPHTPASKAAEEAERKKAVSVSETYRSGSVKEAVVQPESSLEEKSEQTAEADKRHRKIRYFEHTLMAGWVHRSGKLFLENLDKKGGDAISGPALRTVDETFAAGIALHIYSDQGLYVIDFPEPEQPNECYFAAVQKRPDETLYYTLERGITFFGVGEDSVLFRTDRDGARIDLGKREYTDLESFLLDLEQMSANL